MKLKLSCLGKIIETMCGGKMAKPTHQKHGTNCQIWRWHYNNFGDIFSMNEVGKTSAIDGKMNAKSINRSCKKKQLNLSILVVGDLKAPFSIATTLRCRGGRYSFPRLLHLTLDAYLLMLSIRQGGIKYHFLSLWYESTLVWTPVSRTIGEHPWPNEWSVRQLSGRPGY